MDWDALKSNSIWSDSHRILFNKDCRSMADLPDESVQMCVTSPPYWGLRRYSGLPDLIWGGDPNCGHAETTPDDVKHDNLRFRGEHSIVGNEKNREIHPVHSWAENTFAIQGNNSMVRGKDETDSSNFAIPKFKDTDMRQQKVVAGQFCSLCGAWKGAYGLEPTPEMYVHHTVEILREIRRVLRKDGVVFWNCGDSYATSSPGTDKMEPVTWQENGQEKKRGMTRIGKVKGLKPKDLCLIPFRVAIAAQEDGWVIRSVIIWNKPNPMPESVRDRPTESHEYIIMMTKSAKYYWDASAVREGADSARATNWASLSGATIRIECSATLNANNLPSDLRGWHSFHSLEPSINFTMAFHANKLEIGGMISGNTILKYPEGQTVMNLKDCIVTRNATDFALITPLNSDNPSNDMPISPSIIDASPTPHTIFFTDQLPDHPLSTASPTTKVMAWLHILEITPELLTTEITFDKSVAGSPFLIRCSFVSSHLNNIIPQKIRGLKTKGQTELGGQEQHHGQDIFPQSGGRNLRSVWTFPTQGYPGAHFATYPEKLVEICVKAATPEVGCCSKCGSPWVRMVETEPRDESKIRYKDWSEFSPIETHQQTGNPIQATNPPAPRTKTIGWKPQCKCENADKAPSIVLDCFGGAGTTALVATKLNRRSITYELSKQYCELIVNRNRQDGLI